MPVVDITKSEYSDPDDFVLQNQNNPLGQLKLPFKE
jgi:hypothetical protein